jgi:hypothetical protein
MLPNLLFVLLAALVPMIIGFIWYNPKVMGNAWMEASGLSEEKFKDANMALIFGFSFVFALMLAFGLFFLVVHQTHVFSLLMNYKDEYDAIMRAHGNDFRTFKHGAFHGAIDSIFIVLPIMGTNALFDRKGFKYIGINAGYWFITLALMGGILSAWA